MKIALLANLKKNAPQYDGLPADQWDDLDSQATIDAILSALHSGGHEAEFFEAQIKPPYNLISQLERYQPDLCFNIAESHFGDSREAQIPALLDILGLPYTGSRVLTLTLALDKPMTKRLLRYHDLPTPEFQVFDQPNDPIDDDLLNEEGELRFPLFVKPSREGTSVGISARSIVRTVKELYEVVEEQLQRYKQPILVEHFIEGRELTVGVIGNLGQIVARRINDRQVPDTLPEGLHFLPALEVNLHEYDAEEAGVYTNRIKTDLVDDFKYACPPSISDDILHQLNVLTAAVFRVIGCKDVSRVDFRIDNVTGKPYILEVNPLPGLNPNYSDLCIQARAENWTYNQLINKITDEALMRHGMLSHLETHN